MIVLRIEVSPESPAAIMIKRCASWKGPRRLN
jgi:hypothetical protein